MPDLCVWVRLGVLFVECKVNKEERWSTRMEKELLFLFLEEWCCSRCGGETFRLRCCAFR